MIGSLTPGTGKVSDAFYLVGHFSPGVGHFAPGVGVEFIVDKNKDETFE